MIEAIFVIMYTFVLILASFLYLKIRYKIDLKNSLQGIIHHHWKFIFLLCIIFLMIISMQLSYIGRNSIERLPVLLKWSTLFWGTFLLSRIDYQEKQIPNKVIAALLVIRLVFLVYEAYISAEYWRSSLIYPLLGAAIGGGIMAVVLLISRKGLGMGDVKLFLTIGMYVGSTEIIATLFYTCLAASLFGIVLLIIKKAKLTDSIPFAPFAFIGVSIEYVMLLMGG